MRDASVQDWMTRWLFIRGPLEVSTYEADSMGDHVPRVFCILRWARKDLTRTPDTQRDIEIMLSLRVHSQPLDNINEPNLRTYELAVVEDDDKVTWAHAVVAPTVMILADPITLGGTSRSTPTPTTLPPRHLLLAEARLLSTRAYE